MKILSPQTIGLAVPRPGSFTFHLMFSFSLQVIGGEASGEAPVFSIEGTLAGGQRVVLELHPQPLEPADDAEIGGFILEDGSYQYAADYIDQARRRQDSGSAG